MSAKPWFHLDEQALFVPRPVKQGEAQVRALPKAILFFIADRLTGLMGRGIIGQGLLTLPRAQTKKPGGHYKSNLLVTLIARGHPASAGSRLENGVSRAAATGEDDIV